MKRMDKTIGVFMKILDKIVDILLKYLTMYKVKRKLKELKKRDPFIYH